MAQQNLPRFGVTFSGRPLSDAPKHLLPYLDCVDGAVEVGVWRYESGKVTYSVVRLFREGKEVGEITVEVM